MIFINHIDDTVRTVPPIVLNQPDIRTLIEYLSILQA